ncbi:hypothetical protein HYDPIDRAFT_117082 [Hydnomerulius pinastri MD-312]|uniref:Uncharacterized protein n=1 Tax=Hydnomerulius pinastri MD-312 TaxID=994086 RepID=A0A0C9WB65_9AGAM|nr:hypothetical protein HYDPIDRAFT_117082 [Hydnomerulius pinastri MD-312]
MADASDNEEFRVSGEWIDNTNARIELLNSTPENRLFEVKEPGVLVGGDILLCKEDGDDFDCTMENIKPGVWKVVSLSEEEIVVAWLTEGPLTEDLSSFSELSVPEPELRDGAWVQIGGFSVDSGTGGILDHESVLEWEGTQHVGREVAFECIADFFLESGPVVPGGIVVRGNDGGYGIHGRQDVDGLVVEIKIKLA